MAAPLPIVLPPPVAATLLLAHRWRRERCLLCLLWVGAAASPALIPLFPGVSAAGATLLGLAVALGAMGEMRLLRQRPTWARLRAVSALATVLEWQCGLGVIALMAFDPGSEAPTLLLVLLVLTAARYGLRGLAGATLGAILAVAMLVLAQVGPLGGLAAAE